MDVGALGGLVGGIGIIMVGNILEGGHLSALVQPSAAVIVFGGTCGCIFTQFTVSDVKNSFAILMHILIKGGHSSRVKTIQQVLEYAQIARRESVFALEKELNTIEHVFMKAMLGLVVDGKASKDIYEAADTEIENYEHDSATSAKIFEAFGGFCPTIGILGAVLGLIHVMSNLSDPSKLGSGIAVAFVATLYGVGAANLVALPLAGKIKHYIESEVTIKKIIVRGMAMIVDGQNPTLIMRELSLFLPESERAAVLVDAKK